MKENLHVLLIDDSKGDRFLFGEILSTINKSIVYSGFSNCPDALTYIFQSEKLPDIIFLDVHMPLSDGVECLEKIKGMDTIKHIPICMYTDTDYEKHQAECLERGAKNFLRKSTDFDSSMSEIKEVLAEL
jgi:response regulator RpfG family c-di-GMP phosphodiesterase